MVSKIHRYKLQFLLGLLFISFTLQAQKAKKPTLMIVPSDAWCNKNSYMIQMENQGDIVKVPDYKKAFQDNTDLLLMISTMNGLMSERGFPLKNMESELKGLEMSKAKNIVRSGGSIMESPMDLIVKRARADIIIQLTWVVNEDGPKKYITYNLQGLDSYTYKQIATATGSGRPSLSSDLPLLLEEAILESIEDFTTTLSEYFDDMFENGREVILEILTTDDWMGDLPELSYEIEDWLADNAKEGVFLTGPVTDTQASFSQIRMPLFNERGRAMAARNFFRDLSKTLKAAPYNQPHKLETEGLGKVTIVLQGQ